MPSVTPSGIHYPLSTDPPAGHSQMQTLALDTDNLLRGPYGCAGLDANQGPVSATGNVFVGAWVARAVRGGFTVNANGLVAPVAGLYEISAWARFQVSAAAVVRLIIGNTASAVIADAYATQHATVVYNTTIYITRVATLGAGEQIRCGFNQGTASTITMVGGAQLTGLKAQLLLGAT